MKRKKTLLKKFELTEICDESAPSAMLVELSTGLSYYRRIVEIRNGELVCTLQVKQFPIVLDGWGVPWGDAIIYFILVLLNKPLLDKGTLANIAADLAIFRSFLDQEKIDWTVFPEFSRFRPTYRFNGYVRLLAVNDELSHSTAKRTMNSVISFYRRLIEKGVLSLDFAPWEETDVKYKIVDKSGFAGFKTAKTTDVSLTDLAGDARDTDFIYDEGKLQPLTGPQREALFDTLAELKNIEVTLIHLIAVDTACRIQTILTLQLSHVRKKYTRRGDGTVLIPAGPGTGIDTKYGNRKNIKISAWILDLLVLYSNSPRAIKRQTKYNKKNGIVEYLFLTPAGNPFYANKADGQATEDKSYIIRGGSLRKYVTSFVIPKMRKKLQDDAFTYTLHWLRATAGMIKADSYNARVNDGTMTRAAARDNLRRDMWHANSDTTDGYLDYRKIVVRATKLQEDYEIRLEILMKKSMDFRLD